jgi:hypothetical protein
VHVKGSDGACVRLLPHCAAVWAARARRTGPWTAASGALRRASALKDARTHVSERSAAFVRSALLAPTRAAIAQSECWPRGHVTDPLPVLLALVACACASLRVHVPTPTHRGGVGAAS